MYGGVVLCAGESARLGMPKSLLDVGGEAAVARCCRLLREAGCDPVVAVLGAHAQQVQPRLPQGVTVVLNESWARGRTRSVQLGLKALPHSADAVVWPVDHPGVASDTISALLASKGPIRVPVHGGHRGHPIVLESRLRMEVLALAADRPLHDVVRAIPGRVTTVGVNDPGTLLNVDTAADVEKLRQLMGGRSVAPPPS